MLNRFIQFIWPYAIIYSYALCKYLVYLNIGYHKIMADRGHIFS